MMLYTLLIGAICASTALTFPSVAHSVAEEEKRQLPGPTRFNPKTQRISTTGKHKFVPPNFEKGDQRGPCPGLNAMANHGYLPHSGVGTIADFTKYPTEVFGLGADVSFAVAVYGAIMDGDGVSWSIGGPPKLGLSGLAPGLLSPPQGISFSHNNYEGDASATRPDLYVAGNDYKVDMTYFKQLYRQLPATSFATLSAHRNQRVQTSIATNPYYFAGPFTGIFISGGANSFVYRLASNHSEEYPDGVLTKEVFKSFWSVRENKKGELYWKPGYDRIPDNWYRRSQLEDYNFAFLGEDLATYFAEHPQSVKVGGNLGKVDSFAGLDLTNATGGVFNAADFGKGNNAACFSFQAAQLLAPDILSKTFKDITVPLQKLEDAFGPVVAKAGCKKLEKFDAAALNRYPGYSKSYPGYKPT